ncbi:MAG: permease [Desulfuromonas sp.]|nr:MAG: permease [Desulfuromonas sp.]
MISVGLVYFMLIAMAYGLLWRVSKEKTDQSLMVARKALVSLLPLLVAIFSLVGLFQEFVPPELIERWLGAASGGEALIVGGALGAVAIGPPLAAFPLAGSMLEAGAWAPAVAAFIVSWISVGVITLPYEASVFGSRFALLRNVLSFLIALLIGWLIGMVL